MKVNSTLKNHATITDKVLHEGFYFLFYALFDSLKGSLQANISFLLKLL